jgi:hypothetical protein
MPRRVNKRDLAAVLFHLIGTNVLRDPTRLTGHDVRLANGVQESSLAMVDMAEDRNHGWAWF